MGARSRRGLGAKGGPGQVTGAEEKEATMALHKSPFIRTLEPGVSSLVAKRVFCSQRLDEEEALSFLQRLEGTLAGRWYLNNGQLVAVEHVRAGRWGLGNCHANSRWLSRRWPDHYRWWTGYALDDALGFTLTDNHSWVQRADGTHVEVAYLAAARCYIGVPVPEGFRQAAGCTFHPNECMAYQALARHNCGTS